MYFLYFENIEVVKNIEPLSEAATRVVLCKKVFLEVFTKFTGKHQCQSLQVFSCEFCEISKTVFFTKHLRTTASTLLTPSNVNDKCFAKWRC